MGKPMADQAEIPGDLTSAPLRCPRLDQSAKLFASRMGFCYYREKFKPFPGAGDILQTVMVSAEKNLVARIGWGRRNP